MYGSAGDPECLGLTSGLWEGLSDEFVFYSSC